MPKKKKAVAVPTIDPWLADLIEGDPDWSSGHRGAIGWDDDSTVVYVCDGAIDPRSRYRIGVTKRRIADMDIEVLEESRSTTGYTWAMQVDSSQTRALQALMWEVWRS